MAGVACACYGHGLPVGPRGGKGRITALFQRKYARIRSETYGSITLHELQAFLGKEFRNKVLQYMDKLFGAIQRPKSAEEYEGTGIGLSIAQRIVQRHGGPAWAEALVDNGATFYFT